MKFRKLTIENYKSYQFPTELNFPDNEAGKMQIAFGRRNLQQKNGEVLKNI